MRKIAWSFLLAGFVAAAAMAYPLDGFDSTGIRRLALIDLRVQGKLPGPVPVSGGQRSLTEISLNLLQGPGAALPALPEKDAELQAKLEALFPSRDASYAMALLDITPGRPLRYVAQQEDRSFAPGSVGKLAIAAGLFAELARIFPDDVDKRRLLLKERLVRGGDWVLTDHHPVPIFNLQDQTIVSREAVPDDVFSLYEWTDHMLSASANSAASVVWKEAMLMRRFAAAYPPSAEEEAAFWKNTAKSELQKMAVSVVNDPLRAAGVEKGGWQHGTFFTKGGQRVVPGTSSYATPKALLFFLMRLEQGKVVDEWSSLEFKRLLYMTAKRIRYASSPAIARSRVYYKSGSLYKCKQEEGFRCGKYMGNVENFMNSVAIVETSDGRTYLVALMSNVLRKNSAVEHQTLAGEIEKLMR